MLVGLGAGPGVTAHRAGFRSEASGEPRRPRALQPGSSGGVIIDRLGKQNRPLRRQMGFRANMSGASVDVVRSVRRGGHAGIGEGRGGIEIELDHFPRAGKNEALESLGLEWRVCPAEGSLHAGNKNRPLATFSLSATALRLRSASSAFGRCRVNICVLTELYSVFQSREERRGVVEELWRINSYLGTLLSLAAQCFSDLPPLLGLQTGGAVLQVSREQTIRAYLKISNLV